MYSARTCYFDAYFGYDRGDLWANQPNQDQNLGWTLLGIPGLNTSGLSPSRQREQGGMPMLAIDGFGTVGRSNTYQPFADRDPERNYNVNASWLKGTHNIRFGFDSDFQDSNEMQYEMTGSSYNTSAGGFHFAQGTTQLKGGPSGNDFNAFASFLLGLPQDSGKIYQFPDEYYTRAKSFAILYPRQLAGLAEVDGQLRSTMGLLPVPEAQRYRPGDLRSADRHDVDLRSRLRARRLRRHRDKQRIVPRFGVAYRVTDSTVIRAGYAQVTDPVAFLGQTLSSRENFPYLFSQIILPPNSLSYATTLRQGLPPVSPPNLSSAMPVPGYAYIKTYVTASYIRGYMQTWNLTIEQRVKSWLASAGYVASRFIDPQNDLEMNWSPINSGTAGQVLNQLTGRTASTLYLGTLGTNTVRRAANAPARPLQRSPAQSHLRVR